MKTGEKKWDDGMSEDEKQRRRDRALLWNKKHRERINARNKFATPEAKLRKSEYTKEWNSKFPWYSCWQAARQRCLNPNHPSYQFVGAQGIKFLLSKADAQFLWIKAHASSLLAPSLARIDPNGHYSRSNCEFVELSENARRMALLRWTRERHQSASQPKPRKSYHNTPESQLS